MMSSVEPLSATVALYVISPEIVPDIIQDYITVTQPERVKTLALSVPDEVCNQHVAHGANIRIDSVQLAPNRSPEESIILFVRAVGQRELLPSVEILEFLNDSFVDGDDWVPHQNLIIKLAKVCRSKTQSLVRNNIVQLVHDAVVARLYLSRSFIFCVNEELGRLLLCKCLNGDICVRRPLNSPQCFGVP